MPRTLEWYCVMIAHTVRKLINNPIKQIETFLSRLSSYKTCFMSRKTTKKSHFIREYSEWALEADERFSLFFFSLTRKQNQKTETILAIKAMLFDPAPWLKNTKTFALSCKFLNLIRLLERLYNLKIYACIKMSISQFEEFLKSYQCISY